MFRTLASAGLIAAAVAGFSAASTGRAEAQELLVRPAYFDGPAYGWRPPPRAYGYYGARPYWRRHDGPRFYGPPPPPPPPRYYGWRPYY